MVGQLGLGGAGIYLRGKTFGGRDVDGRVAWPWGCGHLRAPGSLQNLTLLLLCSALF